MIENLESLKSKSSLENEPEEYEKGLHRIRTMVFHNKTPVNNPLMVLVGGQSASGKTQLMKTNLVDGNNIVIIALDDFTPYNPYARVN